MRSLKFRAWHKQKREMFVVQDMQITDKIHVCSAGDDDSYTMGFVGEHIELMQFTGLHDKNGREIYEGDILDYLLTEHKTARRFVEYLDGSFQFVNVFDSTDGVTWGEIPDGEIIGNIYENP